MGPAFTGHFRITADTPRGLQPMAPSIAIQDDAAHPKINANSSLISHQPASLPASALLLTKNVFSESDVSKKAVKCASCGVDCTKTRFHCVKMADLEICPICYNDGRFSTSLYSGDFLRMEQNSSSSETYKWTDQETLLLLEGLELFHEDWSKISEHVGTKTRDACLVQFLHLPIEETFVGPVPESLGPKTTGSVPYSPADNPVLALTAFFASIVDPKVAAAAAQAAIAKLQERKAQDVAAPQQDVLNQAAATAFGAAAAKAKGLSLIEEREIQKLTRILIETQLSKMELKMQHFQELEKLIDQERSLVERHRHELYGERLNMRHGKVMPINDGISVAVPVAVDEDVAMGSPKMSPTLVSLN